MEAVLNRDLTWSNIGDHLRDKEGIEARAWFFIEGIVTCFFFESVNTTDTNTKHYANAIFVNCLKVPTTVFDSLHSCNECILFVEVHLTSVLTIDKVGYVEVLYLASKLCLKLWSVEVSDRCSTAHTILNVLPSFFYGITNGGKGTKASNYYSFEFHFNLFGC